MPAGRRSTRRFLLVCVQVGLAVTAGAGTARGAVRGDLDPLARQGPPADDPAAAGPRKDSAVASRSWPNPTLTLVKSAVVPGWGQLTNRRYFKAALAAGLESWFVAGAVIEWRRANRARADFRADPRNLSHFFAYQFHNGNRNDYLWALGITVFISMFDAYVDAHLRPYEVDRIPGVEPPPGVAVVLLSF